ncbi:S1 family peptidase [Acidovorax sp. NCPPB 2350]|nr:S1 family peptidase [Acidovorax sp. NCPPB 2350]
MKNLFLFALCIASSALNAQQLHSVEFSTSSVIHFTKEKALEAAGLAKYATEDNERISRFISENIDALKSEVGEGYAGTWVEYDASNRIKQFVAIAGPIVLSNELAPVNGWEIVPVRFSEIQLVKARDDIYEIFSNPTASNEPLIMSIAVDPITNKLLVRVREEHRERVRAELDRWSFGSDMTTVEVQNGPVNLMGHLYGGTRIISSSEGNSQMYMCTAGFNVVIDNVYPGTITAAHCKEVYPQFVKVYFNLGGTSSPAKGSYIGDWMASGWNQNMDAVIFGNTDFVHVLHPQYLSNFDQAQNVQPLLDPVIGSAVCTSGGTTGWRCGTQKQKNVYHSYASRIFILSEADFCGAPGDSGGPVVSSNGAAVGIFIGAVSNNPSGLPPSGSTCGATFGGSNRSVYQPLVQYLNANKNVKIFLP